MTTLVMMFLIMIMMLIDVDQLEHLVLAENKVRFSLVKGVTSSQKSCEAVPIKNLGPKQQQQQQQ